jgi:cation diffusion facilitator family transporter
MNTGQRVAAAGMAVSGALAVVKIIAGVYGNSMATMADGLESAGDVFASGFVYLGLTLAAKPPDEKHPYGHGRVETLTGLLIGLILTVGGALIAYTSILKLGQPHEPVAAYVIWPLVASLLAKTGLAGFKFHYGRKLKSDALVADGWNDAMDTVSAIMALVAVGLTLFSPDRFQNADRYGGFAVGLFIIVTGARVVWDTAQQLMDAMPGDSMMAEIRGAAALVPGVHGVEKCFARKTGMQYHVDLHLEVDPDMTVRQSHELAHEVRLKIIDKLDWVADVLVHVEPAAQ